MSTVCNAAPGSLDGGHVWGNDDEVVCCEPATPNLAVELIANTWGSGDRPSVSAAPGFLTCVVADRWHRSAPGNSEAAGQEAGAIFCPGDRRRWQGGSWWIEKRLSLNWAWRTGDKRSIPPMECWKRKCKKSTCLRCWRWRPTLTVFLVIGLMCNAHSVDLERARR